MTTPIEKMIEAIERHIDADCWPERDLILRALSALSGLEGVKGALEECVETFALVEQPAFVDPEHGAEVEALGERIGYGALMSSAEASWRARLAKDERIGVGGEYVAGPCRVHVEKALSLARSALSLTRSTR